MAIRSIPPKTSTSGNRGRRPRVGGRHATGFGASGLSFFADESEEQEKQFKPRRYKKPRGWRYVTKPYFAKIKEPLVDVFKEAEEIRVIMDLGGFGKDEVSFGIEEGKYTIRASHDGQEFKEVIDLLRGVDTDNIVESFKNNILELVLPKKQENNNSRGDMP